MRFYVKDGISRADEDLDVLLKIHHREFFNSRESEFEVPAISNPLLRFSDFYSAEKPLPPALLGW